MARLILEGVGKAFGASRAVADVDLVVEPGEFVALLGPSGCGKTTLLRLIAGFEVPDMGLIVLGERTMSGDGRFLEPEDRGLGMVFQSYALWPHMTVAENVGFGLNVRKVREPERSKRIGEALDAVGLTAFAKRRPAELSGGQRQRVALARCLALRSEIILLDEPLANLDAHLRDAMQREFRRLHKDTGVSFIYVTHDQAEAMALADRVAIMDQGRIQQADTPEKVYATPRNPMVAQFVGHGMLVPVEVLRSEDDTATVSLAGQALAVRGRGAPGAGTLCLRAEDIALVEGDACDPGTIPARVRDAIYKGGFFAVEVALESVPSVVLQTSSPVVLPVGSAVALKVRGGWLLPEPDRSSR